MVNFAQLTDGHLSNVQEFLLALPVLLFSLVAHEYARARAALGRGQLSIPSHQRFRLEPRRYARGRAIRTQTFPDLVT